MQEIKIALLGFGTVGSAVAEILDSNLNEISRRAGKKIVIEKVLVTSLDKKRAAILPKTAFTTDINDILNDADVPVVVEVMGGIEPAKSYLHQALLKGKHVITANKALLAEQGQTLINCAKEQSKMLMFEAAIAGGIPIVKIIKESLVANQINKISAIVNGTSNYILSKMHEESLDFQAALILAQKAGYAEADPSFDLDGVDAAHKITLLATIAFGIPLLFEQVNVSGIQVLTQLDIQYAQEMGYKIKPLAITEEIDGKYILNVYPALLNQNHPLSRVDGVMNALFVEADSVGETMYYGPGAGGKPTASSVIADIVEVIRTMETDPEHRVPHLAYQDMHNQAEVAEDAIINSANYIRLMVEDKIGVLASITQALANNNVSIEAIMQKEPDGDKGKVPIVILTKQASEANMSQVIKDLKLLSQVDNSIVRLRIFS